MCNKYFQSEPAKFDEHSIEEETEDLINTPVDEDEGLLYSDIEKDVADVKFTTNSIMDVSKDFFDELSDKELKNKFKPFSDNFRKALNKKETVLTKQICPSEE